MKPLSTSLIIFLMTACKSSNHHAPLDPRHKSPFSYRTDQATELAVLELDVLDIQLSCVCSLPPLKKFIIVIGIFKQIHVYIGYTNIHGGSSIHATSCNMHLQHKVRNCYSRTNYMPIDGAVLWLCKWWTIPVRRIARFWRNRTRRMRSVFFDDQVRFFVLSVKYATAEHNGKFYSLFFVLF